MLPIEKKLELKIVLSLADVAKMTINTIQTKQELYTTLKCVKTNAFPGCKHLMEALDDIIEVNILNIQALTGNHRAKRSIEILGNIIRAITGNLDQEDLQKLSERLNTITDHANVITENVNNQREIIIDLFNQVKTLSTTITGFNSGAKDKLDDISGKADRLAAELELLLEFTTAVNRFNYQVDGLLNLITTKRISGKFLSQGLLDKAATAIMNKLGPDDVFPFNNALEAVMQSEAKISRNSIHIVVTIVLPVTKAKKWIISKITKYPIVHENLITVIDGPEFIATSYDGRTSTMKNIDSCWNTAQAHVCEMTAPIKKGDDCFGNALKTQSTSEKLCSQFLHTAKFSKNMLVKLKPNEVLILIKTETEITVVCETKEIYKKKIKTNTMIRADIHCTGEMEELEFWLIPLITDTQQLPVKSTGRLQIQQVEDGKPKLTIKRLAQHGRVGGEDSKIRSGDDDGKN